MIYITGDTHGEFRRFTRRQFPVQTGLTKDDYVLIAGDFGGVWYAKQDIAHRKAEDYLLDELDARPFTTLFVPGNHENYTRLLSDEFQTDIWKGGAVKLIRPSVLMLMRGELYEIDGKKLFAFGGARSHDMRDGLLDASDPEWKKKARLLERQGKRYYRVKGLSWWEEELPTEAEMCHGLETLAANNWLVDIVVTHCAPTAIQAQLGIDEADALTDYLETVRARLHYRKWFFGHYHEDREIDGKHVLLYRNILQLDAE